MIFIHNDVLVIKGDIARKLLKKGFVINDLKPKKELDGTYDYTRSVFLFKYDDGILEAIEELK